MGLVAENGSTPLTKELIMVSMSDPKKLLDALIAASSEGTAAARDPQYVYKSSDLGDVLGRGSVGRSPNDAGAGRSSGTGGGLGGLGDILGEMFEQARKGAGKAPRRVEDNAGAGSPLDEILRRMSDGQSGGNLLSRITEIIRNNPQAAAAIAAALGRLLLGTKAGRSLTSSAAKLGGLVLIGGLAYKAYKNYRDGQPVSASTHFAGDIEPAPSGTGFEVDAQTDGDALLYIRAMIAAADCDNRIDKVERAKILGGIREVGLDSGSTAFLEAEFDDPATVQDLIDDTTSQERGLQVYTAARLAIEPDTDPEREFLTKLSQGLRLDHDLVAHVDSEVRRIKM